MNVHELLGRLGAARRRVRAGAVTDSREGETALERALRRFERRAEAYAAEMRRLHEAGDDRNGTEAWARAMKRLGRR